MSITSVEQTTAARCCSNSAPSSVFAAITTTILGKACRISLISILVGARRKRIRQDRSTMKLLLMKSPERRSAEPLVSLVCGAPALGIGLVALVALFLPPAQGRMGAKRFFSEEDVSVVERDSRGLVTYQKPAVAIVPSTEFLGMLSAGLCSAALGIYLSRHRRPHCRVTTCKAGIIVCAFVFFILWTMIVIAASR